jgi:ribosomal protein S27E
VETVPGNRAIGASHRYQRHQPENTSLHPIVEQHLPSLRDELQRHETSLPRFVLTEFQDYLRCGRLEYGFLRVKCNGCRHEHLVAFSCKRRGFCPSCGARRMIETSAHLVDHVLPHQPCRQWVLSFPWPLRLLFASQPEMLSRVLKVVIRAIETVLIHRAGLTRSSRARTGVITLIQRFGSALNLNIHLHMIVLDGVYVETAGRLRFHRVGAPPRETLERLLGRIIRRTLRLLVRDGALIEEPDQPWLNLQDPDTLDPLSAASIRYRIALGPGAGQRTLTVRDPLLARPGSPASKPFTVNADGFSLNAAVACQAHERRRLERLCRYITRPAICLDRLSIHPDGRVTLRLKRPFSDGTTHILFTAEDFLARLAALVPRPHHNLTRYHGVFAPSAPFRTRVTPAGAAARRRRAVAKTDRDEGCESHAGKYDRTDELLAPLTWAQRLRRVFDIDIATCPLCGGTLRVISDVTDPAVIAKILEHLRIRGESRAPPRRAESHTKDPLNTVG